MPSDTTCDELNGMRNLLERLHGRKLHLAVLPRHASAFGITELSVDGGEVLIHHVLDDHARASFFTCLEQRDHVTIECDVHPLERQHQHEDCGDIVLVVDGPAAVDIAAFTCC